MSHRILLVDTEGDLLEPLASHIESVGFHVDIVTGADQALERIELVSFDVAILEVLLAEQDGLELLGRIRQSRPDTEVIILTACKSAETALEGVRGGAFDVLLKPCDSESLLERIHRAQEKKEIEDRKKDRQTRDQERSQR